MNKTIIVTSTPVLTGVPMKIVINTEGKIRRNYVRGIKSRYGEEGI